MIFYNCSNHSSAFYWIYNCVLFMQRINKLKNSQKYNYDLEQTKSENK